MTTSRFRCVGCKRYVQRDGNELKVGLGYACSEDCRKAKWKPSSNSRSPKKPGLDLPPEVRAAVFARDHHRCRRCMRRPRLHAHHINYRSEGVDHQPHNIITLCSECHDLIHSNKKHWKPLCLAYIWLLYVENQRTTLPTLERRYGQ